jgi:hypothetical protein
MWEYLIVTLEPSDETMMAAFAKLGEEGWRMTAILTHQGNYRCFFQRPHQGGPRIEPPDLPIAEPRATEQP